MKIETYTINSQVVFSHIGDALQKHRGDIMWWLHTVTDHIVGMTDDYAQKTASLF